MFGDFVPKLAETDTELGTGVGAWATLPGPIRAGIVAMVKRRSVGPVGSSGIHSGAFSGDRSRRRRAVDWAAVAGGWTAFRPK
jgi:hypothetical protein